MELWAFAKCNVGDSRDAAIGYIKMALAASGHHAFRFTLGAKYEPVMVLQREYVPAEHEQVGQTRNASLSDELGLTNYLADRFAVVGTPEECREKVPAIEKSGVGVLFITAIGPQPEEIVGRFGREVLAALK